jgi:uncharacterized protein YuzE
MRSPTGISSQNKTVMKLHYYPETDSLYIDLYSRPSADSREIDDGLVADFDAEGNIVGIDIDHASQKLDLKTFEAVALPPVTMRT